VHAHVVHCGHAQTGLDPAEPARRPGSALAGGDRALRQHAAQLRRRDVSEVANEAIEQDKSRSGIAVLRAAWQNTDAEL